MVLPLEKTSLVFVPKEGNCLYYFRTREITKVVVALIDSDSQESPRELGVAG